jgi:hypothetical protein
LASREIIRIGGIAHWQQRQRNKKCVQSKTAVCISHPKGAILLFLLEIPGQFETDGNERLENWGGGIFAIGNIAVDRWGRSDKAMKRCAANAEMRHRFDQSGDANATCDLCNHSRPLRHLGYHIRAVSGSMATAN